MTPEFEKWVDTYGEAEAALPWGDKWGAVHPLSRRAAHFWLTRLVSEIENTALHVYEYEHCKDGMNSAIAQALDEIKARFGLAQPLPDPLLGGEGVGREG